MVTTIQVNDNTLLLLKKLKAEFKANSYDEAIVRASAQRVMKKSMAGSLAKYYKDESLKDILKELQEERRNGDRF